MSGGHHPRVQETTTPGTVTIEFDEIGRRLNLSATGQLDTTYTYDKNSRLKTVTNGTQTVTLTYDDAGRRTSLTYPNGVVTSYGYDHANRLLTIGHVKTPTTIEALTYTYDKNGNRITQLRQNAAASNLPTAVAATNIAYYAANELTRWNSATTNLTYDNNGNLATETQAGVTTTYTWDARNRLSGISRAGLTGSFVYDGLGRRKSKTINGATTGFWFDGNDVYAELAGVTPSATYIRGLNIDEPYIRKGASDEFYETDALGSSLVLTNPAGANQTTYTYEPFGSTTQAGTASSNAFQYTGRENDGTGLYYYRARYYHPKMQRFVEPDPIGFSAGDTNLYLYVGSSPLRFSDPTGHWSTEAHEYFLNQAFRETVDPSVLRLIVGGSASVDAVILQFPRYAPLHAMTSDVYPTPAEARKAMCRFTHENLDAFRYYLGTNQANLAYYHLGQAMHPVMDYTSPLHRGFQKWEISFADIMGHMRGEGIKEITPSLESETLGLMNAVLSGDYSVIGCKCGN